MQDEDSIDKNEEDFHKRWKKEIIPRLETLPRDEMKLPYDKDRYFLKAKVKPQCLEEFAKEREVTLEYAQRWRLSYDEEGSGHPTLMQAKWAFKRRGIQEGDHMLTFFIVDRHTGVGFYDLF